MQSIGLAYWNKIKWGMYVDVNTENMTQLWVISLLKPYFRFEIRAI